MIAGEPPFPRDFIDIDYDIEKEDWNEYDLKDGVTIKGRIIVLRILRHKQKSDTYTAQTQKTFVTHAPEGLRGTPATPPRVDQIMESQKIPVQVSRSNEVWNVYKIKNTGDRIRVKLIVTDVFRVKDTFDQVGEPFYLVSSGVVVTPASKDINP